MENYNNNIEDSSIFDMRTIVNIVFGKWYIIAASLFVCLVLGAAKIYFSPKIYSRRSEEHTSELQSHADNSYAVVCVDK